MYVSNVFDHLRKLHIGQDLTRRLNVTSHMVYVVSKQRPNVAFSVKGATSRWLF